MTIQNVLDWLQEAEDNNSWQVSTQSVKRHLEEVQKQQLILSGVNNRRELLLDFAEYSENDKTSTATDECVDNYLDSIK